MYFRSKDPKHASFKSKARKSIFICITLVYKTHPNFIKTTYWT